MRSDPASTTARRRTGSGPGRGQLVLMILLVVGATFLLALPTWAIGSVETATGEADLSATGMSGAPAVWAGALVAGAAALLAALSGRVGTIVAGLATFVAGVVVALGGLGAVRDPAALLHAEARLLTGTNAPTVDAAATEVWPWGVLVTGFLLAGAGVLVMAGSARWSAAGRRFERAGGRAPAGTRDGAPGAAGASSAVPTGSASAAADAARDRYVDDWDALGRGTDPSVDDR
ncbi:Trp biosynthesis-associated membrane protein [Georgenia sp. Z1491]|uniref:Trp biosynthesis-associated membrane protein n=1 Tax=Georgenia sp. Z1491 TaxID=3416707 RepID=UPI003CF5576C